MAQANPMVSVLIMMPLGADEPKASSNLKFCYVRWMSLRAPRLRVRMASC